MRDLAWQNSSKTDLRIRARVSRGLALLFVQLFVDHREGAKCRYFC